MVEIPESYLTAQEREALAAATTAAKNGDPKGMLAGLYQSSYLAGLVRQLGARWTRLSTVDVEQVIAEALDALFEAVKNRTDVKNIPAYLWKVCHYRAIKRNDDLERQVQMSSSQIDAQYSDGVDESDDSDPEMDEKRMREEALRIARGLLPRLGQRNVQAVMEYIFDAIEADMEEIPNNEIEEALGLTPDTVRQSRSRGFRRLERICREDGLGEIIFTDNTEES